MSRRVPICGVKPPLAMRSGVQDREKALGPCLFTSVSLL